MKTSIKSSILLALILILQACNNESESIEKGSPVIYSNKRYVSDSKLISYVNLKIDSCAPATDKIFRNQKNVEKMNNSTEIILNPSTPIATNSDLIIKISELEDNLMAMQNYNFNDCSQTESKIVLLTEDFFYIVEKIDTNDSYCVSMFNNLDSFAELLEPSLIEAEKVCPELYNEYMEILDDYNDMYADKLGLIFSSNK